MPVSTKARFDGGTGALKFTRRFASAAGRCTIAALERRGGSGTAARSLAKYRRANHRLAATWISPDADQSIKDEPVRNTDVILLVVLYLKGWRLRKA